MIIGDKNRKLLLINNGVIIVRRNTVFEYDNEYNREVRSTLLKSPKVFNNEIFDYRDGKLISVSTSTCLKSLSGVITDFYIMGDTPFLIEDADGEKSLHTSDGDCLAKFRSLYCFEREYLYFLEGGKLQKLNLKTQELTPIDIGVDLTKNVPVMLSCSTADSVVAFADYLNKIYICKNSNCKLYHWMGGKIQYLSVLSRYILSISNKKDVARFHTGIHRIEPLFKFYGEFVDASCTETKLYLLTSFEFIIFDLVTGNIIFKEYTIGSSRYKTCVVGRFVATEERDIFKVKRQTTIEVFNIMKDIPVSAIAQEYIAYTQGRHIFIVEPEKRKIVSVFELELNSMNYICSSDMCCSFLQRRSSVIMKTFKIFIDRLVLVKTEEITWKGKFDVLDVFVCSRRTYFVTGRGVFSLNKIYILERVVSQKQILSFSTDRLLVIDEKGIVDAVTRKYEVEEKGIRCCCSVRDLLIFYIENEGVYYITEGSEGDSKKCIVEGKSIIDMKSTVEGTLLVLEGSDKESRVVEYSVGADGRFSERGSEVVGKEARWILTRNVCSTGSRMMII